MPIKNSKQTKNTDGSDSIATALAEVSDRLSRLVQDEIELAKTEVAHKAAGLARGAAAVAAGAVFGIFAVVFFLLTLAWVFDGIFVSGAGSLWLGFLIVLIILVALTVGAFLFAWKKLQVGAPTPKMAISEGKKIKDTVTSFGNTPSNGKSGPSAEAFAAAISPAITAAAVTATPAPVTATPAPAAPATPEPVTPEPIPVTADPTPSAALPEPAVWTTEPTPAEPAATEPVLAPEPAVDLDPPTFVTVPEPAAEPAHEPEAPAAEPTPEPETPAAEIEPTPAPATETLPVYDPPALLSDRPASTDAEPVYGVEPVTPEDTDSPSTGAEN